MGKNSTGYDRWDHVCILLLKEGEGKTLKIQPLLANQGCWSLSLKLLLAESRDMATPPLPPSPLPTNHKKPLTTGEG